MKFCPKAIFLHWLPRGTEGEENVFKSKKSKVENTNTQQRRGNAHQHLQQHSGGDGGSYSGVLYSG